LDAIKTLVAMDTVKADHQNISVGLNKEKFWRKR